MAATLKAKAYELKKTMLETCIRAGTGHVTSSLSCAEILTTLFHGGALRFDPKRPAWEDRDRFILSKGQASPMLYTVLGDLGYFPKEDLQKFAQAGGPFGVHLQKSVPGAEITCGSLGHGFGLAAGMALAARMDRRNHLVFTLLGDGECYEGSIWETALFAGHHRLNNLVAIVDRNYQCVLDFTENFLALEPMEKKWEAFGWRVKRVDGHSFDDLLDALKGVRSRRSVQPLVILADTVKGAGVGFMACNPIWHGAAPRGDEAQQALRELERSARDE
ncbi:MAG TPA: transketolase [Kiritimatiellia bacterium]|nr:transketolase [Kiritimatiellia bacterium]HSA16769.1 transketolase [Kiritimatiellia bacterium]